MIATPNGEVEIPLVKLLRPRDDVQAMARDDPEFRKQLRRQEAAVELTHMSHIYDAQKHEKQWRASVKAPVPSEPNPRFDAEAEAQARAGKGKQGRSRKKAGREKRGGAK